MTAFGAEIDVHPQACLGRSSSSAPKMGQHVNERPNPAMSVGVNAALTFADNIGVRILRLAEVYSRLAKIAIETPYGLRSTELRILNILDHAGSVSINEIARRAHVDKAWISRSVRDLESRGLVMREANRQDSRKSHAMITKDAQALLDGIRPIARISEVRVFDGIDEDRFKREMDKLLANAEEILAEAERSAPDKR